jgi:A/G-specific adenine glycosylase
MHRKKHPTPIAIPSAKILSFRKKVYSYFTLHGRDLPWRNNLTPYTTFVSEIMLQQTQVDRVAPFFISFVKELPGFRELARAPLHQVLRLWQGLGYNRRARNLKRAAEIIVADHNGMLPSSTVTLESLPGIGKATAASIAAFGFNLPAVFLETNIRTALIHGFFGDKTLVTDNELLPIAAAVLNKKNPAKWYSALMDYGAMLKKKHGNLSRRSEHYKKQSKFEGSRRQLRGKALKLLVETGGRSSRSLAKELETELPIVEEILNDLSKDNLIVLRGKAFSIS